MQNPLAKQRALLSLRAQAAQWLAECDAALAARGLGFTPEDVAAVEASRRAHPAPSATPGLRTHLAAGRACSAPESARRLRASA